LMWLLKEARAAAGATAAEHREGKAMVDQHGSTQQGSNRSQPAAAHAVLNLFLAHTHVMLLGARQTQDACIRTQSHPRKSCVLRLPKGLTHR
jgi:hypothetical protein